MNQWSTGAHFNSSNRSFVPQTSLATSNTKLTDDYDDNSLTDVSSIVESKTSYMKNNQSPIYSNKIIEPKPVLKRSATSREPYVPDDRLFQSLVDYANSFNLDETVYSTADMDDELDSTILIKQPSSKQRTRSSTNHVPSFIENETLRRNKSCEDLEYHGPSKLMIEHNSKKQFMSQMTSKKKSTDYSDNDKHSDRDTTITDGSKFQWEYPPDMLERTNQMPKKPSPNYHATANNDRTNSNYMRTCQETSESSSRNQSLYPIIIREKAKDLKVQKNRSIRLVHPCHSSMRPTQIIIREIFQESSLPAIKHHLEKLTHITDQFYPSSKLMINPKRKITYEQAPQTTYKRYADEQPKRIIIEYDQINVTVDKDIKQRREIKCSNPNAYILQYGSSLFENQGFHSQLTKTPS